MTSFALALKNAGRRPLRTAVTLTGVAVAIAALFSLLAFQRGYRLGMRAELDRLGAHILVVPKGCPYDAASIALHGARWPCFLRESYLNDVRSAGGVGIAAPAFMHALYAPDGSQVVYLGIDRNMLALKQGWKIEGCFPERSGELLAGAEAARLRGWKPGQEVTLPETKGRRARVVGVLSPTGGADDTFLFLPLAEAQQAFAHPKQLTHILVRLTNPDELDHAVAQLRSCGAGVDMNIVPLTHLFHTIQDLVNSTRVLLGSVALIALLVAGAGVSNTVLMAVVERTREIGIMRAVGASRADIFRLLWLETLEICLVGGVIGVLGAFAASRWLEAWLRSRLPFAPLDSLITWQWPLAGACLLCALVVGSLAGLFPAWRAAALPPIEAMRQQGTAV